MDRSYPIRECALKREDDDVPSDEEGAVGSSTEEDDDVDDTDDELDDQDDSKRSRRGGDGNHQGDPPQTPQLRTDARELKQCFTRYAFSSIGLCCLIFAGIFKFIPDDPIVGLGALSVLPIVYAIARLGVSKYRTSNRIFGFELYLERTRRMPSQTDGRWQKKFRTSISWEEAIHAWRAVEPSLYRAIYGKPKWIAPPQIKPEIKQQAKGQAWFLPEAEVRAAGAVWRPGSFLSSVLIWLVAVASIAILLILVSAWQFIKIMPVHPESKNWLLQPYDGALTALWPSVLAHYPVGGWVCAISAFIAMGVTHWMMRRAFSHARKLRTELMSVHSTAVIWVATVVAHFAAVEKAKKYQLSNTQLLEVVACAKKHDGNRRDIKKQLKAGEIEPFVVRELERQPRAQQPDAFALPGYAFWLAQEAASLASHPLEIHAWIFNRCARE